MPDLADTLSWGVQRKPLSHYLVCFAESNDIVEQPTVNLMHWAVQNLQRFSSCRKIVQQYVYGNIDELKSLQEANLQIYTPNTRFWWRLRDLECALHTIQLTC